MWEWMKLSDADRKQKCVDDFYRKHGPCCAGCDHWRYINVVVGECTKSAPVSGAERASMLGYESCSLSIDAGHILTQRDHVCGDFLDTHDWGDS